MTAEEIIANLNVIYNQNSTQIQRSNAQTALDTLPPLNLVLGLLQPHHPVHIRFYALHIVSGHIANLHPSKTELVNDLKVISSQILMSNLLDTKILKLKFASVFVSLVLRIYPIHYMELDKLLVSLTDVYLVFNILKLLMQDVFLFDMALPNKQGLVAGLMAITLDTRTELKLQLGDLDLFKNMIQSSPNNPGWLVRVIEYIQQRLQYDQSSEELMEAFDTLGVMLEWCPLTSVQSTNVVQLLQTVSFANGLKIQAKAMQTLNLLYQRKPGADDTALRHSFFWNSFFGNYLQQLQELWNAALSSTDEDVYERSKAIANLVNTMIQNHVCYKKNESEIPDRFEECLQFLMAISMHQSITLSKLGLNSVLSLIRNPATKSIFTQPRYVDQILSVILQRHTLTITTIEKEFMEIFEDCNMADFNDTNRIKLDICSEIGTLNGKEAFGFMNRVVVEMFKSSQLDRLPVISRLFETVVSAIPRDTIFEDTLLREHMQSLLVALLGLDFTDEKLVFNVVPMIASFSILLENNTELLAQCLEKLVGCCSFVKPNLSSDDILVIRRKSTSALLKLSKDIPDLIIPYIQMITNLVLTQKQSGLITFGEFSTMIEIVCSVIFGSKTASITNEEKSNFLDSILSVLVPDLENIQTCISTSESFLKFNGLYNIIANYDVLQAQGVNLDANIRATIGVCVEQRKTGNQLLNSFWLWIKRSIAVCNKNQALLHVVWKKYLEILVPLVILYTKRIHELGHDDFWIGKPIGLKKILGVTTMEKVLHLQLEINEETQAIIDMEKQTPIFQVWNYVAKTRQACYQQLGLYSNLECFYTLVSPAILGVIFEKMETISLIHWKFLLAMFFSQFVLNCPPQLYQTFILPMVPPIARYLNAAIKLQWDAKTSQVNENFDFDSLGDVTDDVLQDILLRGSSRAYAQFWESLFAMSPEKDALKKPKHELLVSYCFQESKVLEQWTDSLILFMSLPDTVLCRRGIAWGIEMLAHFIQFEAFWFLEERLMKSAIFVLNDGYQKTNHSVAISLIVQIYQRTRSKNMIAYNTLSQIPGMTKEALDQFDAKLQGPGTTKEFTQYTQSFFAGITGVEVALWGKSSTPVVTNAKEKDFFRPAPKSSDRANILNDSQEHNIFASLHQ